jgi:hypothetical protein
VVGVVDSACLEAALATAFDATPAERRAVVRNATDLAQTDRLTTDRGAPLTVDDLVAELADAPDGSSLAARWNWWLGALDVAYGGYAEFAVRRIPDDADG